MVQKKLEQIQGATPEYHLIEIRWGAAKQNDQLSKFRFSGYSRSDPCPVCHSGYKDKQQESAHIDLASWKGDNFFIPSGAPRKIFIDEIAKEFLISNSISNISIIRVEDYFYEFSKPSQEHSRIY